MRPDRDLERRKVESDLTVERLREQLNETEDGRTVKRLERELDSALAAASSIESRLAETAQLEADLWAELWRTPQAVVWEDYGWTREVALYVRCTLKAEDGDLSSAKEARQRSDRLGLSPLAMLRLHWEIAPVVVEAAAAPVKPAKGKRGAAAPDPRSHLRSVG